LFAAPGLRGGESMPDKIIFQSISSSNYFGCVPASIEKIARWIMVHRSFTLPGLVFNNILFFDSNIHEDMNRAIVDFDWGYPITPLWLRRNPAFNKSSDKLLPSAQRAKEFGNINIWVTNYLGEIEEIKIDDDRKIKFYGIEGEKKIRIVRLPGFGLSDNEKSFKVLSFVVKERVTVTGLYGSSTPFYEGNMGDIGDDSEYLLSQLSNYEIWDFVKQKFGDKVPKAPPGFRG